MNERQALTEMAAAASPHFPDLKVMVDGGDLNLFFDCPRRHGIETRVTLSTPEYAGREGTWGELVKDFTADMDSKSGAIWVLMSTVHRDLGGSEKYWCGKCVEEDGSHEMSGEDLSPTVKWIL